MKKSIVPIVDLDKLTIDLSTWAASPEGQEAIRTAIKDSLEVAELFRESRTVDQKRLHEPVTL